MILLDVAKGFRRSNVVSERPASGKPDTALRGLRTAGVEQLCTHLEERIWSIVSSGDPPGIAGADDFDECVGKIGEPA